MLGNIVVGACGTFLMIEGVSVGVRQGNELQRVENENLVHIDFVNLN